ncbi:MAG: nucleotidyltransferase domain-containing protein [Thermoplasmata archaeon]
MSEFKQTLLTKDAYLSLKEARDFIKMKTKERVTFADVITMMVSKPLHYLKLDKDVREYIRSFVDRISLNPHTKAAILFGSVSRGDYNKYSDVDIATIIDSSFLEYFEYLNIITGELNPLQDRLLERSLSLYISPLIITQGSFSIYNPIYLDIERDGIILFQRDDTAFKFFESVIRRKSRRNIDDQGEVLPCQEQ